MVPSNDGGGYFMVASDGGVFAFGDAFFAGSCPGIGGCSGSAVAVMPDASGNGYWIVTNTGNVYGFGDAAYYGSPGHGTVSSAVAETAASCSAMEWPSSNETIASPRPSMFITEREAKWRSSSSRRAGQLALMQRQSTSSCSR